MHCLFEKAYVQGTLWTYCMCVFLAIIPRTFSGSQTWGPIK